MYARSAGTVGGMISRGILTISAASICSSWNRWRPASSSFPTVSSSNSSALVHQARVHPEQQLGIERVVRLARDLDRRP